MKKALFIVALYLVPFLSVKANIFEDGTVITDLPKKEITYTFECTTNAGVRVDGDFQANFQDNTRWIKSCLSIGQSRAESLEPDSICTKKEITHVFEDALLRFTVTRSKFKNNQCTDYESHQVYFVRQIGEELLDACPPEGKNTFTYSYYKDGKLENCSDPVQINQVDSCNATSGNEYLTIDVSAPSGCFPQADGSICKYDGVDVGGGNQYYALDLEGDCYSNPDGLPDLNGTPKDNPVGDNCVDYGGGVLGCPEDPSNVCSSSGSSFAGGSINNCQTGCGMVNDQFLCIDNDTDGDGLPDYNDPDIDGDGIPNDDDLDSDGDGKDDPINGGNGGGGSSIDLGPVVNELKKLNKQFESQGKPDDIDKDDKLKKKNDDYKTKLEELRDKGAEEMGYVDVLELDTSASLVNATVPENTCRNFAFHPAGHAITLDTCVVADKIRPILTWLIGILTAWHIFFLINKTLREGV